MTGNVLRYPAGQLWCARDQVGRLPGDARDVDTAQAGSASGVLESVEQVGGVLGVVTIGTLFLHRAGTHGFAAAFGWGALAAIAVLAVSAAASVALPRSFRTEDELGLG